MGGTNEDHRQNIGTALGVLNRHTKNNDSRKNTVVMIQQFARLSGARRGDATFSRSLAVGGPQFLKTDPTS